MADSSDKSEDSGWFGPIEQITLTATREQRRAQDLFDHLGHLASVDSEQRAILRSIDEYLANVEASGLPPDIAENLNELLSDGGGILLASGSGGGFAMIRPDGSGKHFGVRSNGEYRIMDISDLSKSELSHLFDDYDDREIAEILIDLAVNRPDVDTVATMLMVYEGVDRLVGLDQSRFVELGVEQGTFDAAQMANDANAAAD